MSLQGRILPRATPLQAAQSADQPIACMQSNRRKVACLPTSSCTSTMNRPARRGRPQQEPLRKTSCMEWRVHHSLCGCSQAAAPHCVPYKSSTQPTRVFQDKIDVT